MTIHRPDPASELDVTAALDWLGRLSRRDPYCVEVVKAASRDEVEAMLAVISGILLDVAGRHPDVADELNQRLRDGAPSMTLFLRAEAILRTRSAEAGEA